MSASAEIALFNEEVDKIVALFHDARIGFGLYLTRFEEIQHQAKLRNPSAQSTDESRIIYGRGAPDDPNRTIQFSTTIRDLKERNSEGGRNHTLIGNLCVVAIFQLWDEHFRERIANALGREKNDLKAAIFGDIRRLRQAIIHHNGIATRELAKAELLTWYAEGDTIAITDEQLDALAHQIREYLKSLSAT